jgi:DNA helicase HerA-like ATPase
LPGAVDRRPLGTVVGGSLSRGLTVRLDPSVSVEELAVGQYVVIEGERQRFFAMLTDIALGATHPAYTTQPPDTSDPFIAAVVRGAVTYGELSAAPLLTLERGDGRRGEPRPVKTIPPHYAPVSLASDADVEAVFGAASKTHFAVGQPLDMETWINLNLERLVERSIGVFGKTGTGKTFLTRLLLAGILHCDAAVTLIFDMHNEYGLKGTSEGPTGEVKGLKQLFGSRVAIFTLDPQSTRQRGGSYDCEVQIGYDQILPEDMELLRDALEMTQAQIETIYRLAQVLGDESWFGAFIEMDTDKREELARRLGLNPGTLNVLQRKLHTRLGRLPFLRPRAEGDAVEAILRYIQRGMSVVLEFGRLQQLDAYMLVANVLTRRIHERYVEMTERALGDKRQEPRHLVITIEEAHKFLSPTVAGHTIFGTIARELRKYHVTLLVVDQRPSGIADEVMSQIGTRMCCLLDDERDVSAVLAGVSGAGHLRDVLARLDTKQQALILGHAVPMPVVIRTRAYDGALYRALGFAEGAELERKAREAIDDLFPGP